MSRDGSLSKSRESSGTGILRSFSASNLLASVVCSEVVRDPSKKGTFLALAKDQCDAELREFLHTADDIFSPDESRKLPVSQSLPSVSVSRGDTDLRDCGKKAIIKCVESIIACKGEQLSDGTFQQCVADLRLLQQKRVHAHQFTRDSVSVSSALTKLLLIVSRVSRLVEFTSQIEVPASPNEPTPISKCRAVSDSVFSAEVSDSPRLPTLMSGSSSPSSLSSHLTSGQTSPLGQMYSPLVEHEDASEKKYDEPAMSLPSVQIVPATVTHQPLEKRVEGSETATESSSGKGSGSFTISSPDSNVSKIGPGRKCTSYMDLRRSGLSLPPLPTPPLGGQKPEMVRSSEMIRRSQSSGTAPLDDSNSVICRICEARIPSNEIEKHMKECTARNAAMDVASSTKNSMLHLAKKLLAFLEADNIDSELNSFPIHPTSTALLKKQLMSLSACSIENLDDATLEFLSSLSSNVDQLGALEKVKDLAKDTGRAIHEFVDACIRLRPFIQSSATQSHRRKVTIQDFEFVHAISRGAFGSVFLARKKKTGDLYAIKRLNKMQAVTKNQIPHIAAERNILAVANSPFLIKSYYSFQTRDNLYLVMEYAPGGDLYSLLKQLGCLEEDMARVYLAQLVCALEYLHGLGIVHRDIKPDNLLISATGHLKLTDFGLSRYGLIDESNPLSLSPFQPQEDPKFGFVHAAKKNGEHFIDPSELMDCSPNDNKRGVPHDQTKRSARKRYSVVGTPDYLAPEVILGTGHDKSVDWWAVGVICYEFLTGIPPFNADTPDKIFANILSRNITWPDELSPVAHDFIDKCLNLDASKRLGSRGGAAEVKAHPFFQGIEWDNLLSQDYAVFVPQLESAEDLSYFDTADRQTSMSSVVVEQNEQSPTSPESITLKLSESPKAMGEGRTCEEDDQPSPVEKRHIPIPVASRKSPLLSKVLTGDDGSSSDGSVGSCSSMGECFPMSFGSPDAKRILTTPGVLGDMNGAPNTSPAKLSPRSALSTPATIEMANPSKATKKIKDVSPVIVKPVVPQASPAFLIATGPNNVGTSTTPDNDLNPGSTPRAINAVFFQGQNNGKEGSGGGSHQELDPDIFRNFSYQNLMNLQSLTLQQQKDKKPQQEQQQQDSSSPAYSPLFK